MSAVLFNGLLGLACSPPRPHRTITRSNAIHSACLVCGDIGLICNWEDQKARIDRIREVPLAPG